jgi:hypothetical protein
MSMQDGHLWEAVALEHVRIRQVEKFRIADENKEKVRWLRWYIIVGGVSQGYRSGDSLCPMS